MWILIGNNVSNIAHRSYYITCIMYNGNPEALQFMKFERGLWWTEDGNYTYYSPTHYWR